MLYGSVDEKATKVTSANVLVHRRKITGATPDGNIILDFDANTFNEKFTEYLNNKQPGMFDYDGKYWRPVSLRVFRLQFSSQYCSMVVYYSFSQYNYYKYSTVINTDVGDFASKALEWGVKINPNIPIGADRSIPLQSEIISTETKPLKVMYGSRANKTKTIYK
jgi:hypothetical protein